MSDYHHLYNRAAWRKLRVQQLRAEPLCRMHLAIKQTVAASVVDHIKPHRGDLVLFFAADNLQSLCKRCHDGHKQAQEHNADGLLRGAGHDGAPLDLAHPWFGRGGAGGGRGVGAGEGGGRIPGGSEPKTAPVPSFAMCHNSEGGVSA